MNIKTIVFTAVLIALIIGGFMLGVEHSTAQTTIDWRTVVASVTTTRTPLPMTATATMDARFTWTPTVPFVVRTGIPHLTETPTPVEILPVDIVTVEVTRLVPYPYYVVITATPLIVEPELPDPGIPTFIVPVDGG